MNIRILLSLGSIALNLSVFLALSHHATPASAEVWTTEPIEPSPHPAWPTLTAEIERTILARMPDHSDARIEWIQGYAWGSMKHVIGGRDYGWVACGAVITPKRSGGERKRQFSVLANPNGSIMFGYAGKVHSSCWTRGYVPINQGG